ATWAFAWPPSSLPVAVSHHWALCQSERVRKRLPSRLNAPARTSSRCRVGGPSGLPATASHQPNSALLLSVRRALPSDLTARQLTECLRCCGGGPRGLPVAASHSRAVPS